MPATCGPHRSTDNVPLHMPPLNSPSTRIRSSLRSSYPRGVISILLTVLFCLAQASDARAQSSPDGSLYSRFGIGELQSYSSSQIEAMGGTAPSMHSLNYLNFSNPGTWSDQVLTRAAAGFTYQTVSITDAGANESRLASGYLNAVQFSFPILERRLGIAVGFLPFSRVSYRVQQPGTLYPSSPEPDTIDYNVSFEGSGGLQQIVGGFGYRINRHLSVGAGIQGYFGIIENGRHTSILEAGFQETTVTNETRLTGISGSLGGLFTARRLLGEEDFITVGAAFTLPTSLSGERVRTLGEGLDRDTLSAVGEGSVHLPMRIEGGLTYHPDARWIVTAGGKYEPWTDFDSDFSFPAVEGDERFLSDRMRVGGGVEFLPAGSDQLAPYLSRVAYRLGFYYDRSYISPRPDEDIRTMAVTGGFSFPTQMSGTRLDINMEVGTRGNTDFGLVQDVFYRLSANVNIGERWFQQTKLR